MCVDGGEGEKKKEKDSAAIN